MSATTRRSMSLGVRGPANLWRDTLYDLPDDLINAFRFHGVTCNISEIPEHHRAMQEHGQAGKFRTLKEGQTTRCQ